MQNKNNKLLGRIVECFGTKESFGNEMGWSKSFTSQKLSALGKWRLDEIRRAVKLLDVNPEEVYYYFFAE